MVCDLLLFESCETWGKSMHFSINIRNNMCISRVLKEIIVPLHKSFWFSGLRGEAQEFGILTNCQMTLIVPVWEPYFENHWSIVFTLSQPILTSLNLISHPFNPYLIYCWPVFKDYPPPHYFQLLFYTILS